MNVTGKSEFNCNRGPNLSAMKVYSFRKTEAQLCQCILIYSAWLGDKMSQRQNVPLHYAPPRRHDIPTYAPSPATFCPTFSILIPIPWAKLGRISGISWIYLGQLPYLWHIYKKTIVQLAFLGDKLSHPTKCPTFSLATKCPNLCTGKLWKVVRTFCGLSHFVNLKVAHVLDIFWPHPDYILSFLSFFYILVAHRNVIMFPNRKIPP